MTDTFLDSSHNRAAAAFALVIAAVAGGVVAIA